MLVDEFLYSIAFIDSNGCPDNGKKSCNGWKNTSQSTDYSSNAGAINQMLCIFIHYLALAYLKGFSANAAKT